MENPLLKNWLPRICQGTALKSLIAWRKRIIKSTYLLLSSNLMISSSASVLSNDGHVVNKLFFVKFIIYSRWCGEWVWIGGLMSIWQVDGKALQAWIGIWTRTWYVCGLVWAIFSIIGLLWSLRSICQRLVVENGYKITRVTMTSDYVQKM